MPRVTRVAPHLTLDEVKQKVHAAKATWLRERWLIIQTALLDPRPAAAIAPRPESTQIGTPMPIP